MINGRRMETDFNCLFDSSTKNVKEKSTPYRSNRITLNLQADLNLGPEFSYIELVEQQKNLKESSSLDGDEDAKMKDLAKEMEKKYGTKRSIESMRREVRDPGYGYDETDPFVDNSECYDEVVPQSLTTKHGGFYINQGALEFRPTSDTKSSNDENGFITCSKKRRGLVIESDDDADLKNSNFAITTKRMKKSNETDNKKRKLSLQVKEKNSLAKSSVKKQKKVRFLVKKAREQQYISSTAVKTSKKNLKTVLDATQENGSTANEKSSHLQESSLKATSVPAANKTLTDEDVSLAESSDDVTDLCQPETVNDKKDEEIFKSLPPMFKEKITSLQNIAKTNGEEGKVKFFSPEINSALLDVELGLQKYSTGRERTSVIQLLTAVVPCSKETLVKRMKRLVTSQQTEILKPAMSKLKVAVDADMQVQMKQYVELCNAQQAAKSDEQKISISQQGSDDDEGNANKTVTNGNVSCLLTNGEEKTKRTYAPRRKFVWNDVTRSLFYNVVELKLKLYEQSKSRNTISISEYLKIFFENELKNLWPRLWMQSRILYKESRKVHGHLTSAEKQPKKEKPSTPSSNSLPTSSDTITKKNFFTNEQGSFKMINPYVALEKTILPPSSVSNSSSSSSNNRKPDPNLTSNHLSSLFKSQLIAAKNSLKQHPQGHHDHIFQKTIATAKKQLAGRSKTNPEPTPVNPKSISLTDITSKNPAYVLVNRKQQKPPIIQKTCIKELNLSSFPILLHESSESLNPSSTPNQHPATTTTKVVMKKVNQQKQQMVKKTSSVSKSPHLYQPPQQMSSQFIKPSQTTTTPSSHTIKPQVKFISPQPPQMIKSKAQLDRVQIHESLIKSPVGETPQKLTKIQQESRKKQKVFTPNTTSKSHQQHLNSNKKTPKNKPKKESVKIPTNDHMINNYDLSMVFNSIYQSTILNPSTTNNDNLHLTYQMPPFMHNFNKDNSNCDSAFNQLNYLLYPNNPLHNPQASPIKSSPLHRSPSSVSTSSSATNAAKVPVTSPIRTIDLTKKASKPIVASTSKWQSHSTSLKTNKSTTSSNVRVLSLPKKPNITSTSLKSNYIAATTTTSNPKLSNFILPKSSQSSSSKIESANKKQGKESPIVSPSSSPAATSRNSNLHQNFHNLPYSFTTTNNFNQYRKGKPPTSITPYILHHMNPTSSSQSSNPSSNSSQSTHILPFSLPKNTLSKSPKFVMENYLNNHKKESGS